MLTHESDLCDLLLGDVLGHVGILDVDVDLGQVALGVSVDHALKLLAQILGGQLEDTESRLRFHLVTLNLFRTSSF
jgi:hypothetical protein